MKNLIRTVKDKTRYVGKDENGNAVFDHSKPLPTLNFKIETKIHGTNAGVRNTVNGLVAQSRERDLTLTSDNAGFCQFVMKNSGHLQDLIDSIGETYSTLDVVLYGEWCGGSIQKGVAVNQLDKMFVVFDIKVDGEFIDLAGWYDEIVGLNNEGVYHIDQFEVNLPDTQTLLIIDFNEPEIAQNRLVQIVEQVEQVCPVGKYFGVSGIGEGVVIKHYSDEYGRLVCKVKGEKHSNSKVKTLAPVDEEKIAKVKDFVATYITESRLEQGIHYMKAELQLEPVTQNIGAFLKWLKNDVIREEQNSIIQNDLDPKAIAKQVSNVGRKWYLNCL